MSFKPILKWLPIHGYNGIYEINNYGEVRSLKRSGRHIQKLLKPQKITGGYNGYNLCKNNIQKTFKGSRLVAIHFLKPVKGKYIVNHKDGNKRNDCITNLEWCTHKENTRHLISVLGYKRHGIFNKSSKLSDGDIKEIRKLVENGVKGKSIASLFNVTPANISSIKKNKTWQHI